MALPLGIVIVGVKLEGEGLFKCNLCDIRVWRDFALSFVTWYMVHLNDYFMCARVECVFFNLENKEFSIAVTGDLNP